MDDTNNTFITDCIQKYCSPTKEKNKYTCPCCGGNNLSINPKTGKYNCWNCGETSKIAKEMYEAAGALIKKKDKQKPRAKFEHYYSNSKRKSVVKVAITYLDAGKKDIKQFTKDQQGKWQLGYGDNDIDATCCLFRWHEIKDLAGVHIVEGENTVNDLMNLGIPATTLLGGSGRKISELNKKQLKSLKNPIICPDCDSPGIKFMEEVAAILDKGESDYYWCYPHPESFSWQQPPPNNGYDLADWLTQNDNIPGEFYKEEKIHIQSPQQESSKISLSAREAINEIRGILTSKKSDLDQTASLYELGMSTGIHPLEWGKLVGTVEKQIAKEQDEKEILADFKKLMTEKDFLKNLLLRKQISHKYKLSDKQIEALSAHFSGLSTMAKPIAFNILDFLELELDSGQILFPGIPATGVTLLGGTYGAGKTLFAFALARAVAEGIPLFGEIPTKQGPVLLVSSDESQSATQDKLLSLGYSQGDSRVIFNWRIGEWDVLEAHVQEISPRLIVVDSYAGIHSRGFDENSADAACTISDLTMLSMKYNCAVLVLHHLNKEGGFRGSTAIPAAAEATLLLTGKGDESRTLKSDKIRVQGGRIDVMYRIDDDRWPIETGGGAAEFSDQETSDQIFNYLLEKGCGEVDEIGTYLGKNFSTIRKSLNTLLAKGLVDRRPSKADKRRRVWRAKNVKLRYETEGKLYTTTQKNMGTTVSIAQKEVQPQEKEEMWEPIEGVSHIFSDSEALSGEEQAKIVRTDQGGGVASVEESSGGGLPDGSHNFAEKVIETGLQAKKNVGTPPDGSHISQDGSHIFHDYEFVLEDKVGQKVTSNDWIKPGTKLIFKSNEGFIRCRFKTRSSCGLVVVEVEKGVEIMVSFEDLFWLKLTNNKKQVLSQLKPGDKAMYKSLQFLIKQNDVDRQILFSEGGGKYSYDECHLPYFPSFKLGEELSYYGKPAIYAGKSDNNWEVIIIPQGCTKQMVVNIDECSKL